MFSLEVSENVQNSFSTEQRLTVTSEQFSTAAFDVTNSHNRKCFQLAFFYKNINVITIVYKKTDE